MNFARIMFAALALSTVSSTAALADTFNFSFGNAASTASGALTFNGSGVLTGSLIAPGEYLITSVTGTTNTGSGTNRPIAGIEAPGTFPTLANGGSYPANDNDLFVTASGIYSFDNGGLSYMLQNGAQVNLFDTTGEELLRASGTNVILQTTPISITAVTPEPGSFLLLGTGMLGTLGVLRRRLMA